MGKTYGGIDDRLAGWIARQPMFFVGTAAASTDMHVNVSPKGPIGTFRVVSEREVAYLDVTGSGAETIAHLRENGRIVIMFCAFDGPPKIVRLHGRGEPVFPDDPRFSELFARLGFEENGPVEARRAIVRVEVERISDSCGYGVPLMRYEGERPHFPLWADKKLRAGGPDGLDRYRAEKNATSIDGLPAVEPVLDGAGEPAVDEQRDAGDVARAG